MRQFPAILCKSIIMTYFGGGGKEHMSTPGHPGNGLGCLNCFFGSSVEQGGLVRVEFT